MIACLAGLGMAAAVEAADTRPPLTGWLLKRKSDASKSRLVKSSNRRFFTMDFESQTFCYSHNVGNKTVSMPTHFRNILGVEPCAAMQAQQAEETVAELRQPLERSPSNGSFTSIGSMTSFFRKPRLPSFSSKRPSEQNGFVVRMRDKSLDLLSESKADADMWIAAIREAVALAKLSVDENMSEEALKPDPSTSPGSSRASTPGSSSLGSRSSPRQALPAQEICEGTRAVVAAMKMFANTSVEGCRPTQILPLRSTSFLPSPRSDTGGEGRIEVPLRPPRSARSTASGEKRSSPRQLAVTSVLKQRADDASLTCWSNAEERHQKHEKQVASRYSDKAEGLSLNQRLSQLEFSDDEDLDEADESKPAMKEVQPEFKPGERKSPASAQNSVTVEACEDFVAPDSDED